MQKENVFFFFFFFFDEMLMHMLSRVKFRGLVKIFSKGQVKLVLITYTAVK
jgi:hypothetical protein